MRYESALLVTRACGLRDYGTGLWDGGNPDCDHTAIRREHGDEKQASSAGTSRDRIVGEDCRKCGARRQDRQLGLEPTPDAYITGMVAVFREVRRVLKDTGVLFLNVGDSYASDPGKGGSGTPNGRNNRGEKYARPGLGGLKPKDLVGIPWMLAFALRADGWWLRSDIIWAKPNPMPESIQGSRWERHRVTMVEYEELSRLRGERRSGEDGTSDLPAMQTRQVPSREAALSTEREGEGDGTGPRGARGREGEAPPVLSVGAGTEESGKVRPDAERAGDEPTTSGHAAGSSAAGRGSADGGGLADDLGAAQASLLLLQEAPDAADAGSCDPAEQGWEELAGERGPGVPVVQLPEAGQDRSSLLVDCPGCPKCEKNDGLILRMSAGRPTQSYEHVFLFSKSASYHYDSEALREPHSPDGRRATQIASNGAGVSTHENYANRQGAERWPGAGRNGRNVWTIATQPTPMAHFATYPEELVRRCILAGSSERGVCPVCGKPWEREMDAGHNPFPGSSHDHTEDLTGPGAQRHESGTPAGTIMARRHYERTPPKTLGWRPSCTHDAAPIPATILDPFFGSGTTGLVARKHGRRCIGIELSLPYAELAARRLAQQSLLAIEGV